MLSRATAKPPDLTAFRDDNGHRGEIQQRDSHLRLGCAVEINAFTRRWAVFHFCGACSGAFSVPLTRNTWAISASSTLNTPSTP